MSRTNDYPKELKTHPSNDLLKVPLTKDQKERIRLYAQNGGFSTLSAFARSRMLSEEDLAFNSKLNKILQEIEDLKKEMIKSE